MLVISPEVRAAVRAVVEYAEAHRYSVHDLMRLFGHPENAPGHTPGFVVTVPTGYRCVFTIEQQPDGWMRHLSVSIMQKDRVPATMAVAALLPLFGFKTPLNKCHVHLMSETVDSVNVLELLETQ